MEDYKIAFFDIDGTLVDNRSQQATFIEGVPESTKVAIKRLKAAGILPVIATGRGKQGVLELGEALGIESLVASNGQEIIHQGEQLYHRCIEQSVIDKLFQEFQERDINVLYETLDGVFSLPQPKEIIAKKVPIHFLEPGELPQNVLQLIVQVDDGVDVRSWLTELKCVKVSPNALNVLPFGVSKASGIHFLMEKLNIPLTASLGFGDEENDLEMFTAVGTAVAMGNACEALKAKADLITKEVWHDGIYHGCQALELF